MASPTHPPVTLFYYPLSPKSQKIISYLALRQIPYTSCVQPSIMPRPDLTAIGVQYRRIPVLAIGKDIYCDVALSMRKLDQLIPYSSSTSGVDIHLKTPADKALADMLCIWMDDVAGKNAMGIIPPTLDAIFANPVFVKDRTEFWGRDFTADTFRALRGDGLVSVRATFEWFENGLLGDGREWLLGGEGPSVADLHVAWLFAWFDTLPGSYEGVLTREAGKFMKVWAWLDRYKKVVKEAEARNEVVEADGETVARKILSSSYAEEIVVVEDDALELEKGDHICGWPTDTGFTHKDTGRLVGLTAQETVIETAMGTRVHHPRHLFKVEKIPPKQ